MGLDMDTCMGLMGVVDRINKKASFLNLPELKNEGEVPASLEGWVEIFEKEMTKPRLSDENLMEILEEKVQEVPKDEILSILEKLFKSHSFKFFLSQDKQAAAFFIGLLIEELDNALADKSLESLKEHFCVLDGWDKGIVELPKFPERLKNGFFLFKVKKIFEEKINQGLFQRRKKAVQQSFAIKMVALLHHSKLDFGVIATLRDKYGKKASNECIDLLDSLSLMQYIAGKEIDKEAASLIFNRLSLLEMIKTLPALERGERKSFLEKMPELKISKVRQFFLKISYYIIRAYNKDVPEDLKDDLQEAASQLSSAQYIYDVIRGAFNAVVLKDKDTLSKIESVIARDFLVEHVLKKGREGEPIFQKTLEALNRLKQEGVRQREFIYNIVGELHRLSIAYPGGELKSHSSLQRFIDENRREKTMANNMHNKISS